MSPVKAGPVGFGVGVDCQSCRENAGLSNENTVGQQIHDQILQSFRPYTEPDALNYVNSLVQKIAEKAQRRDLQYQATILYNEQIYATSAPGGAIYITTGFIYFLKNEAELAGVLAHEIGELQYKDPKFSRSHKVLNNLIETGAAVAPAFGQIGMLAALGLAMVKSTTDGKEPTLEERLTKADQQGMEYMAGAGQDPQGMIDLMYQFLNAEPEIVPYFKEYYQARPITVERMQAMQNTFKELPIENRTFTTNREHFLEMTKGIREIYQDHRA